MPVPDARAPRNIAARLLPCAATLLLAAASAIGAALILAREINYGVGTTLDSVAYISTARNAADGNGFVVLHNQSHYVNSPPLFPALLALAGLLGLDPLPAAGYLNAAAFGAAVFMASMWLRRRVRSSFILAWATVALVVAPPLVRAAALAMSEAIFIPLTLASLLLLIAFMSERSNRFALILSAVFAGLAILTRWFGAPLALTAVILLLLQRDAAFRHRAASALLYLTIAMAPICLWLARNLLRIGKLSNHGDIPPTFSFTENLSSLILRFAEALTGWSSQGRAVYFRLAERAEDFGANAALIAAGVLLAVALPITIFIFLRAAKLNLRWRSLQSDPVFILTLFALVYVCSVVAGISVRGVENFSVRYYAPVHAPILLAAALLLDRFLAARRDRRAAADGGAGASAPIPRDWAAVALAGALILWLLPQANLYADFFQQHLREGLGITARAWRESEVIRYLQTNPPQGEYEIASNVRGHVYLLVGLPVTHHQLPCDSEELRGLARWMRQDGKDLYIIWSSRSGSCVTPDEIRAALDVETAADLSDGAVFLSRRPG